MFTDWQHPERIPPVMVLGFVLCGPLTLGHVLLLDELGSPIVRGESFQMDDLAVAALVCAQPAGESRKDIRKWWAVPFMVWVAKRAVRRAFIQAKGRDPRLWKRVLNRVLYTLRLRRASVGASLDFTEDAERFSEWFSAQCGGPTIDTGDEKMSKRGKPMSAPWYISKLALAVGELGMSVGDACDMPVKRLNQIIGALQEQRGDVKFITEGLAKALEKVAEQDRELAEAMTKGAV